ncbi:MAG: hypothetical protein ACKOEM_00155 [Planctomycetia bacterium]
MERTWQGQAAGRLAARQWDGWEWLVAVTIAVLVALGFVRRVQAAAEVVGEPTLVFEETSLDGVVVGCPSACCPPASCRVPHVLDPLGVDPLWSGRAEALLLWRQSPQGLVLFEDAAGGAALDASQLGSGLAAGPRLTLFRHTGDDGAIEFNYLRVQTFEAVRELPSSADGYFQTSHGIYCCPSDIPANNVAANMSSALQSFELNRRFPTDAGWQWLTGFRWVEWREGIAIQTSGVEGLLRNSYSTSTFNDLYGWQVGADSILYGLGGPFRIEGLGKAGVYYNNAVQNSVRTTTATMPPSGLGASSTIGQVAFVGEVGLTAVYDIYDWLSVRGGYAAFWLGGLAQAPNQLFAQDICPGQPLAGRTDTGGSVWIQGITIGLEARY